MVIWERWNSYTKEGGIGDSGMSSFIHYAFGSVCEWMFENMAGIKIGDAGFRTFVIKPEIADKGINLVDASYHSINGMIRSFWKRDGNRLIQKITVPVNARAEVWVRCRSIEAVRLNGTSLKKKVAGLRVLGFDGLYTKISIGSGCYTFDSSF